jgi:hypothetical protein
MGLGSLLGGESGDPTSGHVNHGVPVCDGIEFKKAPFFFFTNIKKLCPVYNSFEKK